MPIRPGAHVVTIANGAVSEEAVESSSPASLDPVTGAAITEITWDDEDALPFPFCLSAVDAATDIRRTSASHAAISSWPITALRCRRESLGSVPEPWLVHAAGERRRPLRPGRTAADVSALPAAAGQGAADPCRPALRSWADSARAAMQWSLRDVQPAITLTGTVAGHAQPWTARRDLLNSSGERRRVCRRDRQWRRGSASVRRRRARPPTRTGHDFHRARIASATAPPATSAPIRLPISR